MLQKSLTDVSYVQKLLAQVDGAPKRSMGQNFLICPEVIEAAIAIIEAGPKNITELGSGIGTLTQALEATGFNTRAIEKDDTLVQILKRHTKAKTEILHGDMQDIDWQWGKPYQVVGNIPYNLTGLIVRRLTQLNPAPKQALFLMQEEVARRLVATAPDMSLIGLAAQLWGKPEYMLTVPQNCFWPQPKVRSALVLLTANPEAIANRESVMKLAKSCFQTKRKQIQGTLKRLGTYTPEEITKAFEQLHIPSTARPQELSADQWHSLWQHLEGVKE